MNAQKNFKNLFWELYLGKKKKQVSKTTFVECMKDVPKILTIPRSAHYFYLSVKPLNREQ